MAAASPLVRRALANGIAKRWVRVVNTESGGGTSTTFTTLSGPNGGYQRLTSSAGGMCRLIFVSKTVYVSCNPRGGATFVGWSPAGAERIGTTWVAYRPADQGYRQLSVGITTTSNVTSMLQGKVGSPATTMGGSTSRIVSRLYVTESGSTHLGAMGVAVSEGSHPLITEVVTHVGADYDRAFLSGWGSSATWRRLTRKPARSVAFRQVESVLQGTSAA